MVGVAQLVEPWFVVPVVAGSSPVAHPNHISSNKPHLLFDLDECRLGDLGGFLFTRVEEIPHLFWL